MYFRWIFIYFVSLFVVTLATDNEQNLTASSTSASPETDERKPSMFKIGDEWLALPEVFSNLDFNAPNKPASDDDIEGQMRLRSTRFWGRLYIDG